MRAGTLNKVIDIEQRSTTQDGVGQQVRSWTVFASQIYARVRPLSAKELLTANAVQNEASHEVTIRYLEGVTGGMRVKLGTRYLQVVGRPRDIEERGRMIVMLCTEGVADG